MPVNSGDTAWVLVSSALVLLMTPGLALFYGGMARRKNLLSTIMMSFAIMSLVGIIWVLWGYTLSFGSDTAGFIGGSMPLLYLIWCSWFFRGCSPLLPSP